MRFFRHSSFLGLGASVAFAIAVGASDNSSLTKLENSRCDMTLQHLGLVDHVVGRKDSSNQQCETQYARDYTPVTGIEVWRKGDEGGPIIAGIRFTYASGVISRLYGYADTSKYPQQVLRMIPGEIVTKTILYGNGVGLWLGHIHIETSQGQTFDVGRDTTGITPYEINVGGGIILGAYITPQAPDGSETENIANFGFIFLAHPIDRITITNVKFESDPTGTNSGISPVRTVVGKWYNHADKNAGYSLSPTYDVPSSYSYSQQTLFSFGSGIGVEMNAQLFRIGSDATSNFRWGVSYESATTTGATSSTTVTCKAAGTLLPSQGVSVIATYLIGTGVWKYNSTVTVYLKDDSKYTYSESGTLTNVAFDEKCITKLEGLDDPNISSSSSGSTTNLDPVPTQSQTNGI